MQRKQAFKVNQIYTANHFILKAQLNTACAVQKLARRIPDDCSPSVPKCITYLIKLFQVEVAS